MPVKNVQKCDKIRRECKRIKNKWKTSRGYGEKCWPPGEYYLPASPSFVVCCMWRQKCSYSPLDGAWAAFIACMCLVNAPTMAAIRSKAAILMWPFAKLEERKKGGKADNISASCGKSMFCWLIKSHGWCLPCKMENAKGNAKSAAKGLKRAELQWKVLLLFITICILSKTSNI